MSEQKQEKPERGAQEALNIARLRNWLAIKGLAAEIAMRANEVINADRDMVVASAEKLSGRLGNLIGHELRALLFEEQRLLQQIMQAQQAEMSPPEPEASPQELIEEEVDKLFEPPKPPRKLSRRERKKLKAQKGNGIDRAAAK